MLTDNELLPDNFVSAYGRKPNFDRTSRKWHARWRRNLIKSGAHLCRLDFNATIESPGRRRKEPVWPDWLLWFCCYFMVRLSVAIYNQYGVDYHKYALDKFDKLARQLATSRRLTRPQADALEMKFAFRSHLVNQFQQAQDASRSVGAPYLISHMHNIAENIMLYFLIVLAVVYLCPQLYYRFCRRLNYSIMCIVIEPDKSQAPIDSVIRSTVNDFISSSKVFNETALQPSANRDGLTSSHEQERAAGTGHFSYSQLASNQIFLVDHVKSMAWRGMLQPYNRRTKWIRKLGDIYALSFFGVIAFLFVVTLLFLSILPSQLINIENLFDGSVKDVWFYAELQLYNLVVTIASAFYVSLVVAICLDQVHEVSQLSRRMNNCIVSNTYKLRDLLGEEKFSFHTCFYTSSYERLSLGPQQLQLPDAASRKSIHRAMNISLVHTLLQYKIFIRQIKGQLETLPIAATILIFVMFFPLALGRLLMAYLSKPQRLFTFFFSLMIMLMVLVYCAVICRCHARCLDVYRKLQSLRAHTVFVDQLVKSKFRRGGIYDRHLVGMLRSELREPEKLVDQFVTRPLLGLSKMTYGGLLQTLFWWGLLAISFLQVDTSLSNPQDIFGRVWRFYRSADRYVELFFQAPRAMLDSNGTVVDIY